MEISTVLNEMHLNNGQPLTTLTNNSPVLLIFLRHFGCIFCREAIKDISKRQRDLESKGINVVFVHMADNDIAHGFFNTYGIENPIHISDPDCNYYHQFGLTKGKISQLFGLKTIMRGMEVSLKGTSFGLKQVGDGFQMPGIFMIREGAIVDSYIHRTASDRPDYDSIINCCAA